METRWPGRVWIVRHGESAGSVAHDAARAPRAATIEIEARRDMDVSLSPLGERQVRALGRWFAQQPDAESPEVVLTSPYARAERTARLAVEAAGLHRAIFLVDERLREREFGLIDRLTWRELQELHPEQAKLRSALGKFYDRPPGGENWCDVLLRLRSVFDSVTREFSGRRVLIVCHTAVVMCFRYLLEGLDEAGILAIDREHALANCGVTRPVRASPVTATRPLARTERSSAALTRRAQLLTPARLRRMPLPAPAENGDKENRARVLIEIPVVMHALR